MDRIILHCDLNSFYASVELRSRPDLQNVPVAVCGDPTSRHGIILAKNEPAKKFGVQTAETIWQAKKKCPELVLLPPHHKLYRQVSKEVNTIYEQYTDLVEPFGIDESWLDVTHTLHLFGGDAKALADHLRQRMKQEMGLTLSVGVSFNKVFAKLGSDYRKPDATTVVSRENWQRLVWPLPVGALLYVGGAARKILAQFGVKTIGELAACKRDALETLMGKMGVQLHDYANGLDTDPVRSRYEPEMVKSVGNGTTFPKNLTTAEQVRGGVAVLADSVATRLRHSGLYAGGVVGLKKVLPQLEQAPAQKLVVVTVGVADPAEPENVAHIRASLQKQLPGALYQKAQFAHLRGGIDYSRLNFKHRAMMWAMVQMLKKRPPEQQSAEDREIIRTYNQKVDFTDLASVEQVLELLQ